VLANDIHNAFLAINHDGKEKLHPAGRLLVHDGKVHHLEDYHGLLSKEIPEGPIDNYTLAKLAKPGSGLKIGSESAIKGGHRLDLVPEANLQRMPAPARATPKALAQHVQMPQLPSVWHYTRSGHDEPHVLESHKGKVLLDGNPLKDEEVAQVLDNVRTGSAKLRYVKSTTKDRVAKMESAIEGLAKADMDPQDALAHLDALGGDEKTQAAVAALRRHVFEDPMNPGVGNKYAYEAFRQKNQPGTWTSLDVNDLKHLNDNHGHDAGDALIRGFGGAARKAVDPNVGKLFRAGGDEYVMWHPTPAHAQNALRQLRNHVDAVPPINGVHKISFSAGMGPDFDTADKALYQAKARKYSSPGVRAFKPGHVPHLAHSLVPGAEGPVPLDPEQTQSHAPQLAAPKSASGAA
jgi:GGDEF domain-containing protein